MKSVVVIFLTIILVLVLFFLLLTINNEHIYRGNLMPPLKSLVEIFCPPKDLFKPIVYDSLGSSQFKDFKFRIKYPGKYSVDLLIEGNSEPNFDEDSITKIVSNLIFLENNTVLMEQKEFANSLFISKEGKGILLTLFNVPKEIPMDTTITCRVNINAEKKKVLSENIKFIITKLSEL